MNTSNHLQARLSSGITNGHTILTLSIWLLNPSENPGNCYSISCKQHIPLFICFTSLLLVSLYFPISQLYNHLYFVLFCIMRETPVWPGSDIRYRFMHITASLSIFIREWVLRDHDYVWWNKQEVIDGENQVAVIQLHFCEFAFSLTVDGQKLCLSIEFEQNVRIDQNCNWMLIKHYRPTSDTNIKKNTRK